MSDITKEQLISFTNKVITVFEDGKVRAPVHFSGGNEDELIKIFKNIKPTDYVFSTWRSHYHALLHGVQEDWLLKEIQDGHSITIQCPEHRFYTSAIVGSIAPLALGVAMSLKNNNLPEKVWCFVGDMSSTMGIFYESLKYAEGFDLPIHFIIEDNKLCVDTPTRKVCGESKLQGVVEQSDKVIYYKYKRRFPHMGIGKFINF